MFSVITKKRLISKIASAFVTTVCAVGIVTLQQPTSDTIIDNPRASKEQLKREKSISKTRLNLVNQIPGLGFDNLIADWTYLKFIQYFGDGEARSATGYSLVPEYFEAMVNHDPRFIQAYLALSPANSLYAGQPQKTVALIEEGLQSISPEISRKSPYLWMYKGSDEMLFLGDTEAAQHSYEMAAKWAETYDNPQSQSLAANARQTAQFLANNSQSKQARVGAWSMILSNAPDEATRQRAIKEIEALGGEVIVTPQGRMKVKTP